MTYCHIYPHWYIKQWDYVYLFSEGYFKEIGSRRTTKFATEKDYYITNFLDFNLNVEISVLNKLDNSQEKRHSQFLDRLIQIYSTQRLQTINRWVLDQAIEEFIWMLLRGNYVRDYALYNEDEGFFQNQLENLVGSFSKSEKLEVSKFFHIFSIQNYEKSGLIRRLVKKYRKNFFITFIYNPKMIIRSEFFVGDEIYYYPISPDFLMIFSSDAYYRKHHKKFLADVELIDSIYNSYNECIAKESEKYILISKYYCENLFI